MAVSAEKEKNLTVRQEALCMVYASMDPRNPLTQQQAGELAGFAKKSAYTQVSDTLKMPKVQARIKELKEEICGKYLDKGRILQEMASIAYSNPTDVMQWDEAGNLIVAPSEKLSPEIKASISSIEVHEEVGDDKNAIKKIKFKFHDKKPMLLNLGKEAGMFNDKVEHGGNINVTVKRPGEE
jgi:hypothetical protein